MIKEEEEEEEGGEERKRRKRKKNEKNKGKAFSMCVKVGGPYGRNNNKKCEKNII